jgi:iron complex transport system permease protein
MMRGLENTARLARRSRDALGFGLAAGLLVVLFLVAFASGRFPVTFGDLLRLIWSKISGAPSGLSETVETVIFKVRGPRVLASMAVGATLAAAGAAYQGLFRNPLVSPDILGVSSGAALGAVLGIYLSLGVVGVQLLAFGVGLAAVALVYLIGASLRHHDPILILVLAGVVIGTLLGSAVGLIKYIADPYNQLPAITFWLLGSLTAITAGDVWSILPAITIGLIPLYLLRWHESHDLRRGRGTGAGCRYAADALCDRLGRHLDDRSGGLRKRHHRLDRPAYPPLRPFACGP